VYLISFTNDHKCVLFINENIVLKNFIKNLFNSEKIMNIIKKFNVVSRIWSELYYLFLH